MYARRVVVELFYQDRKNSDPRLRPSRSYAVSMESDVEVMVVEDDAVVRAVVTDYLQDRGYSVTALSDGIAAREALRSARPDVLVLDRMLPGVTGDELCRQARTVTPLTPIIMLTALDSPDDRIDGLEHGADDYLAKPFALRELQLRIDGMIRRARSSHVTVAPFTLGPFRVDPAHRRVWNASHEVTLTSREYDLFLFLLQNPDRVLTRDDILREVWGWGAGEATTVTVHVRRLRAKIEPEPRFPRYLLTEWGRGYLFSVEASS